jgi:hypothetical protein
VDGVATTSTPIDFDSSTDLIWSNGRWDAVATITVDTPELHTVSLWGREDGFAADKIVITASGVAPTGTGPAESPQE